MAKGNKQNNARKLKRKAPLNHFRKQQKNDLLVKTNSLNTISMCSSAKKLNMGIQNHSECQDLYDYNILINFSVLKNLFLEIACPKCHMLTINLFDNTQKRMGFSHNLELKCTSCDQWSHTVYSSKECVKNSSNTTGRSIFEANARAVIAFREIGRGHSSINTFTQCMNMYGLAKNAFDNLNSNEIYKAYNDAALKSMKKAAEDLQDSSDGPTQQRIKIDGAWQKRGHSSLNGFVTGIVEDKVVDVQAFSKHCKGCLMWDKQKGSSSYDRWKAKHVCNINHVKSSGAMEGAGAVKIFERSVEKNSLIYKEYLGDGDSSSYKEVIAANPYKDFGITPLKLECIGHVQKRLGTRLRNLVKSHKGTKNPISGKGKLTEKTINSKQTYYGKAIRNNLNNVYAMKKAIGSVLFHCTAFTDENQRHEMCPRDDTSWCKWQLDKTNKTKTFKNTISLPMSIHYLLKPIFVSLSDDELLNKCVHGQTQNTNESFNSVVWTRCPKNVFIERRTFECSINSAILHYNDGSGGVNAVLGHFGFHGKATADKSIARDCQRVTRMEKRSSPIVKKQRKKLRAFKKGYMDKENESEKCESYTAGGF